MSSVELIVPKRPCPVCLAQKGRLLFRQTFCAFSEGGLLTGYDLVVCGQCGAAYADGIPAREVFDIYYARMSKYEQSQRSGELSATDKERFSETADMLAAHLRPDSRIVGVGCATGGLLAELQRRGFHRLLGLDPSPACATVAKRLYGIEVRTMTLHELTALQERFDVVVLTGVFEHLPELDESIALLRKILQPGGLLYLEVPDASSYHQRFSAPYQFLSIEHVNFFSPASLSNLLARRGFDCIFAQRVDRHLGPQSIEPAVAALFSPTGKGAPTPPDLETEPALLKYLESSHRLEEEIQQKITRLAESQIPLAVWGAGTHTLRLLETSKLGSARIVAFIDSNARYRGKQLRGIPIVTPQEFHSLDATILISSQVAESEIKAQIRTQLGWTHPIICFYENSATA
ncbi:MAG TPA: class I SAM-dependent methyltransferase [Candidatus Cybelea sp.]|nr:class I SAM-dependent methyltransferase [Candidatus Cybelea sp.]